MIGFTGAGIDRADLLRLQPDRIGELASSPSARLMRLDGLDPVLADGRIAWSRPDAPPEALIFLGLEGDAPLFAPLAPAAPHTPTYSAMAIAAQMEAREAALWGAARSLVAWHARHGFCPNCGSPSLPFRAGWGRKCTVCAAEHYPRVDPVVIMLAEHRGRILLARQPQFPPGRYSALAGFVEPGESIEEAVAREFHEEAALPVADVRYVASQPWPFPHSLMIACIASASTDRITLDRTELEDAMWVDRAAVAAALAGDDAAPFRAPPPIAIAHTLLSHWLAGGDALA